MNSKIEAALKLKYKKNAHIKDGIFVNCNGLICEIDSLYKSIIIKYLKKDSVLKYKNFNSILLKYYYIVDSVECVVANDLILFKAKTAKTFSHVAFFIDSTYIIHAKNEQYNVVIQNIREELMFNQDYIILRKRGKVK